MKIIVMGGSPATGKTEITKMVRKGRTLRKFKYGLVSGDKTFDDGVFFLGVYSGDMFDGTDRLSMAVQPVAERFIRFVSRKYPQSVIFLEGDRLFNQKFIDFLQDYDCIVVVIVVDRKVLEDRHRGRDDTQPDEFLRSRETKVKRIVASNDIVVLNNNMRADLVENVKFIKSLLDGDANFEKIRKNLRPSYRRSSSWF